MYRHVPDDVIRGLNATRNILNQIFYIAMFLTVYIGKHSVTANTTGYV